MYKIQNYPTWFQAAMNELDEEFDIGNIDYEEYQRQERWLLDDLEESYKSHDTRPV